MPSVPWLLLPVLLLPWATARIVTVGDLHGDVMTARRILKEAGLLLENPDRWAGGTTTLVQMGDVVDRGTDGHAIMDLFMTLRPLAEEAGGAVIPMLGNHEVMNLKGDWGFVDPRDIAAFGSRDERRRAYGQDGRYGRYIRSLPITRVLGSTVFCHGGLIDKWARLGEAKLNELKEKAFDTFTFDAPILSADGPVWTRDIIYQSLAGNCAPLEASLAALSAAEGKEVRRMVIGHTGQPRGQMSFLCNDMLAAVDVYVSSFFEGGGWVTYLEIDDSNEPEVVWKQVGPTRLPKLRQSTKALVLPLKELFSPQTAVKEKERRQQQQQEHQHGVPPQTLRTVVRSDQNLPFFLVLALFAMAAWWHYVLRPRRLHAEMKKDLA